MTTRSYTELMAAERQSDSLYLTAIHVDLKERSIILEADQTATKLTLTPEGIRYELLGFAPPITEHSVDKLTAAPQEKPATIMVTGRLKSQPKPGRPDNKGNATAWARLAVHEDDQEGPHLYSTTFHRKAAEIALTLPRDAQITVQGYPHPSSDPEGKRMDTLSVFHIVNYPGRGKEDQG